MFEITNEKIILVTENEMYKKIANDVKLIAILNKVYAYKASKEIINSKVQNQLNAINVSVNQINPKFASKSKNYGKVSNEILYTMSNYEIVLNQISIEYNEKLDEILKDKVEIETKILLKYVLNNISEDEKTTIKKRIVKTVVSAIDKIKGKIKKNEVVDVGLINKLQDSQDIEVEMRKAKIVDQNITVLNNELADLNQKINKINEDKENEIINALEKSEKSLSLEIKKPRTFNKITKYFVNRFNTYNAIMKNVILPINQRIEEFRNDKLMNIEENQKIEEEFEIIEFEKTIEDIQNKVLKDEIEKIIIKNTSF